ncbi:MAG: chemotaxis protein CheA [Geminicoccaceae bacterium]|nr:chemotaxis protein CheA [Geminicoccaceae bacterium]
MNAEDQFRRAYLDECLELLEELETGLSALDDGERDRDTIDAVFRAVHSIKGGAGMFALDDLVRFAHGFETTLDMVRNGDLGLDQGTIHTFLRSADVLSSFVDAIRNELPLPLEQAAGMSELLVALGARRRAHPADGETGEDAGFGFFGDPADLPDADDDDEGFGFFDDLPEESRTEREAEEDRGFGFFDDPPQDTPGDDPDGETDHPAEAVMSIEGDPANGLALQPCGNGVSSSAPQAGSRRGGGKTAKAPSASHSIRVELDRIDSLVNQVGELVITQAVLKQQSSDLSVERHAGLIQGLEELALQTRELQESVMSVRAQPVKSVFSRMPRLVRELAASLGKEARLILSGEHTEVDKTVIEELADPLTHMLRNSMDHGLERPEERIAAGKPAVGTIHLSAEHRSGRILITISDDGRGIDRDRVLEKARLKGLVPPDGVLSNDEIDHMIFAPGFSTAAAVSDVSGRGVGMDVVKRKIQDLGGRITINSMPGKGTRFTLMLPLTLAVLDGMIVRVGHERYIVPITAIVESLRPRAGDVHVLPSGTTIMQMRGTYLPLVFLYRVFGIADAEPDPSQALVVVVETEDGSPIGVVVDDLLGQQQVVIKSLETNYQRVGGVAGATILGNGLVALILDVDALRGLSDDTVNMARPSLVLESSEVH